MEKYSKYFFSLLLIAIFCLPLFNLLNPGLPVTHDGQDHIARVANFYKNLQEGNIIPRWAGNLNWGYGHPILMFLYPLPSYMASLFHFFGFNFVDSVKLVFAVSFVASGLSMYLFMNAITNRYAALVSAVLYVYAPYRFVDLYVRGAIGEHVAFIFPPLVFFFLYRLSQGHKRFYAVGGALSVAGFILGHNAISLMFLPLIGTYICYLFFKNRKKSFLLYSIGTIALGFGLASFFWVPAFFEGKYTLRDIVTRGEYVTRFVSFKDLLYGKWDYGGTGLFTVQIGIVHWIFILISVVLLFMKNAKNKILLVGLLFIFATSLFIMTYQAKPLWEVVTTLQKFQFPWRFLSVSVFISAFIGGLVIYNFKKSIAFYLVVIAITSTLVLTKDYWQAKAYLERSEEFYSSIYNGTTDTGESAPIWSVRFMEKRPSAKIEIIEGTAKIEEKNRNSTVHEYRVKAQDKTRIKENTLYFPGWHVYVNNNETPIEFQDRRFHGIMTFYVPKGESHVRLEFKETKLRSVANSITGICLVIIMVYSILNTRIWRRFRLF